jgi:two-component system chemotaxis sensor kinase CheA
VEEVIDLEALPISKTTERGRVVDIRGRIVPLESLSEYLPLSGQDRDSGCRIAIVGKNQLGEVAFGVQKIVGQQSIVVRQLTGEMAKVPGFSGATVLSDGDPSMILHLPHIMKSFFETVR